MTRYTVKFWLSLTIILICYVQVTANDKKDISVLNSNSQACEVIYEISGFSIDTLESKGQQYHRLLFDHASPWTDPADPLVPARVLIFGIPDGAEPIVSVTAGAGEIIENVTCLPTPEMVDADGIAEEAYTKGEMYQLNTYFPNQHYRVYGPVFMGQQRVVAVHLFPLRYHPESHVLEKSGPMTVRIQFGRSAELMPAGRKVLSKPEHGLLVNGSAVASWKTETRPTVSKQSRRTVSGIRIKIPITDEAVYRITGDDLEQLGVSLSSIDPATIKILGRSGKEFSRDLSVASVDTLRMVPCLVEGVDDGEFGRDDAVMFYAVGTEQLEWSSSESRYRHFLNRFTTTNIYWLAFNDDDAGLRAGAEGTGDPAGAADISNFREVVFSERDALNPLNAGLLWYDREFRLANTTLDSKLDLPHPAAGEDVEFYFYWAGGTYGLHKYRIDWNSGFVQHFSVNSTLPVLRSTSFSGDIIDGENELTMTYSYDGTALEPYSYLDWIEIEYTRRIQNSNGKIRFFSPSAAGNYRYRITGFNEPPVIFHVTDPYTASVITPQASSGEYEFTLAHSSTEPSRFIASDKKEMPLPAGMSIDVNSDLKHPGNGCDMLIITHSDFYSQASRLAEHRRTVDSLEVQVVDVQDVYDEFSGGMFDPGGIRNFVKYAFDSWSPQPQYLLLFGDGDYDYRNIKTGPGGNWIPPYEKDGSTSSSSSATDDWYTYVNGADTYMDLAVGRIPVQTAAAAEAVVDKIIRYESEPEFGIWKNIISLVADDEKAAGGVGNEVFHTRACEYIAEFILPKRFDAEKIYLTEYDAEITGDGLRKPQAKADLLKRFNLGAAIVDYIGHGNQKLWAHEWIFHRDSDLDVLENDSRLPLIYAATCSFGWYDKLDEQSFGEELVNRSGGGAVAVIASSRLCSAPYNESLNKEFLRRLLDETGPSLRIGDALRLAKSSSGSNSNNELYHILGDPALRLAIPRYEAVFTSMSPDSLRALGVIQVTGAIKKDGSEWSDFNGNLMLQAFDSRKPKTYTTEYGSEIDYILAGNSLFRGEADVINGEFTVSFVVPKDISYGGFDGRLSSYFWNSSVDGGGYKNSIPVGGSSGLNDTEGPDLQIGFSGRDNFVSGDMVTAPVELTVRIEDDKSGVNLTGEIGHKIVLSVDDASQEDITSYFSYDKNEYLKGSLTYALPEVEEGSHTLTVKAWDNANNSTLNSLAFTVVPDDELRLERVMNYPNPFDRQTDFTFYLSLDAEVVIKIFTVSGRLIRTLDSIDGSAGFNMAGWDGTDEMGDRIANGVYLYKVIARSRYSGKKLHNEKIERLIIMR